MMISVVQFNKILSDFNKDEQALISFHEAGFFRELQWKRIKHDKMDEKAIDGWFQFDYVLDLAKGSENH